MSTPRRILVPVDFSPPAIEAVRYARGFQAQYAGEIHVLHVLEDVHYVANTYMFDMPTLPPLEDLERDRQTELNEFVQAHLADCAGVHRALCRGKPFVEILRYAQEVEANLIIISSRGLRGLEHALFGSTAEKVMRKSACPVLVLKVAAAA